MILGTTFIDGDFTTLQPHGAPRPSFPLNGDSIFSGRDIVYYSGAAGKYITIPLGTFPNLQPWSAQQACLMVEQDFMVYQASYEPLRLNTFYNEAWSLGWEGVFGNVGANSIPALGSCMLVGSTPLEDMGGGISKFTMRFVSLPATRNEAEDFPYTYIGLQSGSRIRPPVTFVVTSRIQEDYFIFDDWGVTAFSVYPNGPKLNAVTGIYPPGIILQPQFYFQDAEALAGGFINSTQSLSDQIQIGISVIPATVPSYSDYAAFLNDGAELVVEASKFDRWMGNIFKRRTRFAIAI